MSFFKFSADFSRDQELVPPGDLRLQARAFKLLNIYRFALSLIFSVGYFYIGQESWLDHENTAAFLSFSLAYLVFSSAILFFSQFKTSWLTLAQPLLIVIDILFIVLLMHAAGGIQSGLGLFLIITIVTASLVSNGRLALFYASVASICLLLEQSYQIISWQLDNVSYTQPVILSLSCFATAWLAYSLAKRMQFSEALASARGVDIENLAQVNALITQEMQDGVIVVDQNLNIRHHNLQALSLLALSKNNSESISFSRHMPEVASAYKQWLQAEASNSVIISVSNRELKLRFKPLNHGRKQGGVIFIQDWSQMQSAAQQAKLAALGRLTANIAHEIRNPLSAISHANQLLQEEENISAPTTRILQIIADNIQRIDRIIKDVLELNRSDRTQQTLFELNHFLADFYTQFCAVEKIPQTHFRLVPYAQPQMISFDQRHLTQILWNLAKNGWEHSKKTVGSLSLHCSEIGNAGLNIEMRDDGHGISEQDKVRLFEPFFTTKSSGSGLGLYISRELAAANGASLQYQALATGSAFTLQLKKA
jgi:two-component system sensor histidine kinase PilS (NtrC family)